MPRVFVFGALMRSAPGRAGGTAARVLDHEVAFVARGIRFFEPAFAALVEQKGAVAHGVVYDVSESEWEKLRAREAGYLATKVVAEVNGEACEAIALRICDAERLPTARAPSRRYARILLDGALEHRLPADWIERLRELERSGPKLTAQLSFVMTMIVVLIPHFGLSGAIAAALILAVGILATLACAITWAIQGFAL